MASTTSQVGPVQVQFRGKIKLAVARTVLADFFQHTALHVHQENLVAKRIAHVDSLRRRIDRDSCWPFEKPFSVFQAANGPCELPVGIKNENLASFGIRHIDIVLRIDGHALGRFQRILAILQPRKNLYFSFAKSKMCTPCAPGSVTIIRPCESVVML